MKTILSCGLGFAVGLGLTVISSAAPDAPDLFGPASDSDNFIAGVFIGDDGQPVAGAEIKAQGINTAHGGQQWGEAGRFVRGWLLGPDRAKLLGQQWGQAGRSVQEPVASDAQGRFRLRCKSSVELIYAMVTAPGAAARPVQLQPGRDYVIRMQEGVRVTGRLVSAGRPVSGTLVRLQPCVHPNGEYYVSDPAATDSNGCFVLPHQPAERSLLLFTTLDSPPDPGVLPPQSFTSGKNHATTDLGDLKLQPGFRVAGRMVLADGTPAPAHTRVLLARSEVSDFAWARLDAGGRFAFPAVPAGSVSVGARLQGYKFSQRNPSLDWLNDSIVGRVDHDLANLTLVLEPGEFHYTPNGGAPEGVDPQPRDQPLRGANDQ
jgi:hypothetical protein